MEKCLCYGVVIAVAFTAVAGQDSMTVQKLAKLIAGILTALIRVKDHILRSAECGMI